VVYWKAINLAKGCDKKASKDGAFRLTALNKKFPDQMKEADRIMREDRDVLHELARR